ncbi:MAG: helix-turn-helix transcriptional regulator, partial [Nakamurella sp.]
MSNTWPESSTLGEIIRRQRELAALPMRQLAAMAGISNPYLSQIERGLRDPSEHVLHAIAASLQVSAETLRSSDEEDKTS